MSTIPKVLLLIDTRRSPGRGILRGIAKYSSTHGPWAFNRESAWRDKSLHKWKKLNADADGIIIEDSSKTPEFLEMDIPVIIVSGYHERTPGHNYVISDSAGVGKLAAEHLINCKLRYFAFCGYDNFPWSRERCDSFSKTIRQAGLKTLIYKQPKSRNRKIWENELPLVIDWLKSLPIPVGIMACNDDRAQEILEACKIAGLNVPDQIAVIGVDNDQLVCELTTPSLSSVCIQFENAGFQAAQLLEKMMAGEKISDQKLFCRATHVIERQSTNIMLIDDKDVVKAMRFIQENPKKLIQVDDVAKAASLSRRTLERRFKKAIGRSVSHEIRHVRAEQIARMLEETNLSVMQIAIELGYPDGKHLARVFCKEKGISPSDYRKNLTQPQLPV